MRLNAYIAKTGYASRRKADGLIRNGDVQVNGEVVKDFSFQVKEDDKVRIKNKDVSFKNYVYIMFNKPAGVTTTLADKFADKKIMDLLPAKYKGLYPVGRLDKNSCGLIILTNDGDFCYELTHPKFEVEKEYLVRVKGVLSSDDCRRAREGVVDEGDSLKVKKIRVLSKNRTESLVGVVVGEGKKRHLRRLFKQLGVRVVELMRVRIGRLRLGDLEQGRYRVIGKRDV